MAASSIALRLPPSIQTSPAGFTSPSTDWLLGSWHVTHSTLPMWRGKTNVRILYSNLPPTADGTERLDDLVTYQADGSSKIKRVEGVDTASKEATGVWDWRGKGWLKVASSHWAILGHGETTYGHQWVVTHFAKTVFTGAGIDIYSKSEVGLPAALLEEIKTAISALPSMELQEMAKGLFEIKRV